MESSLYKQFDNIILLDLETTGLDSRREEIIELAALRLESGEKTARPENEMDYLIKQSQGKTLPADIVRLTGITPEMLEADGVSKKAACDAFCKLLTCSKPLIVAYNAQFDLCFLYYFLKSFGRAELLRNIKMLDALTVYKDRRPYPHTLSAAVEEYSVQTQNTHRAIDDVRATSELLEAMEREDDDLNRYINLFGFNPRYGVSGPRISSITYKPQPYNSPKKIYE